VSLQYANKSSVCVCCGVSGSGKSCFAIRYLLNAELSCRFIFDPRGEYSERLRLAPVTDLAELNEAVSSGWVCFDPHVMFPGKVNEGFESFCEYSFHASAVIPGQKCLFVDEVWKYCDPNKIPIALAQIVQDGRKNGIGLFVNTQRPNRVNEAILNEAQEFVCFRLRGKRALECVAEYGTFDEDELRDLPDLCFVAENVDSGCVVRGQIVI
jgi:hypothetical protein